MTALETTLERPWQAALTRDRGTDTCAVCSGRCGSHSHDCAWSFSCWRRTTPGLARARAMGRGGAGNQDHSGLVFAGMAARFWSSTVSPAPLESALIWIVIRTASGARIHVPVLVGATSAIGGACRFCGMQPAGGRIVEIARSRGGELRGRGRRSMGRASKWCWTPALARVVLT